MREATSFGTAFIRAENGSSRPGQSRENSCQVVRPSSRTPVVQRAAEPELVPGDGLGAVPERPAAARRAAGPVRVGDDAVQGDELR